MRVGVLTLSDKGSRGERIDASGPALVAWLTTQGATAVITALLPDQADGIARLLADWADGDRCDLLLTTGGTGVSPRDVTPEATRTVIEREVPGFAEEMRRVSRQLTPHALISRAVAGIRQRTLIINLPGSPKGAIENLAAIWPAIPHAVAKIRGDQSDCGS